MNCPSCDAELEPHHKFCYQCGEPVKVVMEAEPEPVSRADPRSATRRRLAAGTLTVSFLLLFIVLLFGDLRKDQSSESSSSTDLKLNASVVSAGHQLLVINKDDSSWIDVEITIDPPFAGGSMFSAGYKYRTGSIEPNQLYSVDLKNFVNDVGQPFNPSIQAPKGYSIKAKLDGKSASVSGRLN